MPHWLQVVEWLAISVGISVGIVLVFSIWLFAEFHTRNSGYLSLAAHKLKFFLFRVFIAELVIGICFYLIFYLMIFSWVPFSWPLSLLLSVVIGMIAATFPYLLERQVLPKQTSVERLKRTLTSPLTKLLDKLNLVTRSEFAEAISVCRERDVFDCQSNGWNTGLTPTVIGRRIRIIYELKKEEIARQRRDPSFLHFDAGRTPWEKFYILVRFIGRDELRRRILNPPPPPRKDWDGQEYRRTPNPGSRKNRTGEGRNIDKIRCYDYPRCIESILKGEEFMGSPEVNELSSKDNS